MTHDGMLKIIHKNWHMDNKKPEEMIDFPLYETNYVNAVRNIFHSALKQSELIKQKQDKIFKNEFKNMITFIGVRGSGKTTAMDEFCRILQDMHHDKKKDWWIRQTLETDDLDRLLEKRFKFYITAPIDASLLGEKDDLFELILVNIYRKFQSDLEISSGKNTELTKVQDAIELFQEIFRMYHVSQENKLENLHDSFSLMNYMAGSYEIQGKVADLIDKLLDLKQIRYDFEYIVIAIDDLDLNLHYGYQMLELLQKYFSYYKIFIITAIDYSQMSLVCEDHFEKEIGKTTEKYNKISRNEHNRKLANDYMTKLFPFSQRTYMPDIRKQARNIHILAKNDTKEIELSVKKYIMIKIAQKMKIYYDACGLKRHFCELDTIRELVSYNDFLDLLIPIAYDQLVYVNGSSIDDEQKESNLLILRKYDRNHEQFNRDIEIRLSQNLLTPHQKDIFMELNRHDLERRANYFVNLKIPKKTEEMKEIRLNMGMIYENRYTYGDILERIYRWGRVHFELKPLLSCIMASFTSEMVREYLNYRYNPIEESRQISKKRLFGFLGNSFGNSWCTEAFPKIITEVNDEPSKEHFGYLRQVPTHLISVDFRMEGLEKILHLSLEEEEEEIKEVISEWMKKEQVVETLECIDLFFIRKSEDDFEGLSYSWEIGFPDTSLEDADDPAEQTETEDILQMNIDEDKIFEEVEYLSVTGTGKPITLDIMAFVLRSLDYESHKKSIQQTIVEIITDAVSNYLTVAETKKLKQTTKNLIRDLVAERSLFTQQISSEISYECAFPFYDLDLSYNLWKRTRKTFFNKFVKEDIFKAIRACFQYIKKLLKDEASFYQTLTDGPGFAYEKNFSDCPYVKFILGIQSDEMVANRLSKILRSLIINQKEPETVEE